MGVTYNIIETDFKRDNSSAYQLSILIGMDSLVYSIYVRESGKLLVLKTLSLPQGPADLPARLQEALSREDLLQVEYGAVKVLLSVPQVALVPTRLYNEAEKETYLSELISDPLEEQVLVDDLEELKVKVVYQVEKQLLETIREIFPACRFYEIATPFLLGCLKVPVADAEEETAFACFAKNAFQLAIFRRGELMLYNTYHMKSASDVLYFTLLAFEQYGLSPNDTALYLSGEVVNDSDIYKLLYRYVAHLHFQPPTDTVQFGPAAAALDPDIFFSLHSALLCD